MAEQVYKHHSVYASIRMIADGDERTVWEGLQAFRMLNFVFHSDILQHSLSESRSFKRGVPVIQVIHLIHCQSLHQNTGKGVACLSAEGRSNGFQLIESKKRHSSHFCHFTSKLCDKMLRPAAKICPNRRRFLPLMPFFAIFERMKYRTL